MKYLDTLKESFTHRDQINLLSRLRIRLRIEDVDLLSVEENGSEEEIDKRYPISLDIFAFSDWKALREEIEQVAIEYVCRPHLLEALFVRYIQPFDTSSQVLFPDEKYSNYEDLTTSVTLRSLSSYYGYNSNPYDPTARTALADYLQSKGLGPVTEERLNAFQRDFFLLHRLLNAMNFVAEIVQGVLFEASSSFSLQTLREDCHVKLTDELFSWKMAPLLGWTSAYCRKLMGDRDSIDLDVESIDISQSDNQLDSNNTFSSDSIETEMREIELPEDTVSAIAKHTHRRLFFLSDDKIRMLGEELINSHITKRFGESLVFIAPATLYAYMGYRLKVVCGLNEIPWQQILGILPHRNIRKDNNFIKGRASYYKKTQSFPPKSEIIDQAVNRVFKISDSNTTSQDSEQVVAK